MTGHNPTDRSKLGTKRHILTTDKDGIPLSAIITSANTHDVTVAIDTIVDSNGYQKTIQRIKRNRTCALIKHIIPKK
jgi:IS5 family transposase